MKSKRNPHLLPILFLTIKNASESNHSNPRWISQEVTLPRLGANGTEEHRVLTHEQTLSKSLERSWAYNLHPHIPITSQSFVDNDGGDKPCTKLGLSSSDLLYCTVLQNSLTVPNNLFLKRKVIPDFWALSLIPLFSKESC